MSAKKKLVIVVTRGFDDDRASVAWSVANGGIASEFEVTMFLVSSGVDWVRRGAAEVDQGRSRGSRRSRGSAIKGVRVLEANQVL